MPSWSRDGDRILFSSNLGGGNSMEIWVMDPDGSNQRQLTFNTPGGNFTPLESPDGTRIAFSSARSGGNPEVWVMNADGSGEQRLTTTPQLPGQQFVWSLHPTWSADGKRIAYASTRSGSTQIWIMNADGSAQTQLTFGLGSQFPDANVPSWSLDSKLITFWAGFEGQFGEVWVMNPDGTNPKRITDTPDPMNSDDPQWSPDGTKIVFGRGAGGVRSMYLIDVASGQVTPLVTGVQWCTWQPIPVPG